jgi:hypothetical protein
VFHAGELEEANLRGLDKPPSWNGYYFLPPRRAARGQLRGLSVTRGRARRLPLARVPGHGPRCCIRFSRPARTCCRIVV